LTLGLRFSFATNFLGMSTSNGCEMHLLKFVTQGPKTRSLSLPRYWVRGRNRRERFSSLQFFNSAGVHEFAL